MDETLDTNVELDETPKPRRGRKPTKEVLEAKDGETVDAIDIDETPQSRHRKKIAKEISENKKAAAPVEEYYEIRKGKLLKVQRSAKGNLYRIWICNEGKQSKPFIDGLRKQGLIRA